MNISPSLDALSDILTCVSQPARIQILVCIGYHEACVCHLEAALHMSQASISQHLMILRKNGLVIARRDGRHIYYSLANPKMVDMFHEISLLNGIRLDLPNNADFIRIPGCPCPMCSPDLDPKLICKTDTVKKSKKTSTAGEKNG
jgi:DNA-binding transcriptional ArsR family regulator